jgi:transcriptional adapter 3
LFKDFKIQTDCIRLGSLLADFVKVLNTLWAHTKLIYRILGNSSTRPWEKAYTTTFKMPPSSNKSKNKIKDNRQSRSRNTTPSSVLSGPASAMSADADSTSYLKLPLSSLMIPSNLLYDDIVDRNGGTGGIPDPKHLESLANNLRTLLRLSNSRENECDKAMRELSGRRKIVMEEERERELEQRERREAEDKSGLKRQPDDDDEEVPQVTVKKRKEPNKIEKERPLAVGAHGLARQDGGDVKSKLFSPFCTILKLLLCAADRI